MFFSGAMAGLMVIGIVKVFAGEQLVSAAQATGSMLADADIQGLLAKGTAAVGWLAIFNALGRVAWGFVSDKVGRTTAFVAMFSFQAVVLFLLDSVDTEMGLAVAASIIGFNFGGNFALFPSITADAFGAKNLGANYGWIFTSYGIAGVIGIAAGNAAKTITGSYRAAFILAAVLCLISAGLAMALSTVLKKRQALPATA
jgi:OFA family oxalate/formate antiporter-like MFS transporter